MRKTTAPRTPSRPKVQRANQASGLIAKAKTPRRSVATKSALVNRSHRTSDFRPACKIADAMVCPLMSEVSRPISHGLRGLRRRPTTRMGSSEGQRELSHSPGVLPVIDLNSSMKWG